MTAIENLSGNNQQQAYNLQDFRDGTNSGSYSNLSAPFYGPLPFVQNAQGAPGMTGDQIDGEAPGFGNDQAWTQQPQGRFGGPQAGSNWDAMFGEDWSGGWTDQGYGQ